MRREKRAAGEAKSEREGEPKKACCMVSEMLEEAGIDRARARQIRRQVLEGVILMCQWQLQRMEERREASPPGRRGRKIDVE